MLHINGNYLEGGGQIVRTALALSTLTGIPFRCTDIRKGRKDAGLKAQHLTAITALKELCDAECEGAELGATEIIFHPKPISKHILTIDIGTAGSISLLLQSLLPPLLFADRRVTLTIIGGTDVAWAMPIDYVQHVLVPQLLRFGKISIRLIRRGYYPKGAGMVEVKIQPLFKRNKFSFDDFLMTIRKRVKPYALDARKNLLCIKGISHASMDLQQAKVAERQAHAAKMLLNHLGCPIIIDAQYYQTLSAGSGITLYAVFGDDEEEACNPIRLGADALGERGKKAEVVGEEAAKKLLEEIKSPAAVDIHLADNLLPYLALCGGKICTSALSQHTKTNMHAIGQFLGPVFTMRENCVSVACTKEERI